MIIDSLNRDSLNMLYSTGHEMKGLGIDIQIKKISDYQHELITYQKISSDTLVLFKNPIINDKILNHQVELREKSLLAGSKHIAGQFKKMPVISQHSDWVLGIFLFCIIVFANIVYSKQRRFRQLFKSFSAYRNINNLIRDGNLFSEFSSLMLFIVFILTSSLLIYFAAIGYEHIPSTLNEGVLYFLKIAGAFTLLYLLRITVIAIVGKLFKNTEISYYYMVNILVIDLILGIILLPILILIVYVKAPLFLYFGLIIYIVVFTYRLLRGILIGSSGTKFSKLYLFLYLCTLEILPLIVLIKLTFKYLLIVS